MNKLREIEEALSNWEVCKDNINDYSLGEISFLHGVIKQNAPEWLRYQRSIIDAQADTVKKLTKERDFYHEDRDRCERMERKAYELLRQKEEENKRLRQALISERDEAMKWDGIGTVNRINKALNE